MTQVLPVNISAAHVVNLSNQKSGNNVTVPAAPAVDELANWDQETYAMTASAAVTLGFPIANVDASAKSQVLIFGMSRWKDVESDDQHVYRYGVSVRCVIHVRDYKGDGSLTIPVVSAKVELGDARAEANLSIRGWTGSDLKLPNWQSFTIDAYSDYQSAVSAIQDKFVSEPQSLTAELLATSAVSSALPGTDTALGVVLALEAISHGESMDDALAGLDGAAQQDGIRQAIQQTYASRVSGGGGTEPAEDAKASARDELRTEHITRRRFGFHW
jgi:hypothetical protein